MPTMVNAGDLVVQYVDTVPRNQLQVAEQEVSHRHGEAPPTAAEFIHRRNRKAGIRSGRPADCFKPAPTKFGHANPLWFVFSSETVP